MNWVVSYMVIYHLISPLLPHYLAKFESLASHYLQQSSSSQKCAKSFI